MAINTDPRLPYDPYETGSSASLWTIIVALVAAAFVGWLVYAHSGQPTATSKSGNSAAPVATERAIPAPDTPSPAAPAPGAPIAPAAPTAPAPTPPSAP
jgi:hypothetical protein